MEYKLDSKSSAIASQSVFTGSTSPSFKRKNLLTKGVIPLNWKRNMTNILPVKLDPMSLSNPSELNKEWGIMCDTLSNFSNHFESLHDTLGSVLETIKKVRGICRQTM